MTDAEVRDRICVARALAIFAMIYVHVPGAAMLIESGGPGGVTAAFLIDGAGRASAALLAIISGWLCARLVLSGELAPLALVQRRVRTVVLPMVFWAGLTLLVYALVSIVRPTFLQDAPDDLAGAALFLVNTVVFLTADIDGPTLHLSFLRDLFVCTVLTWPLIRALRLSTRATLAGLLLVYVLRVDVFIVLRPLVLLGFTLGVALALNRVRLDALDRHWPVTLAAACVATATVLLVRFDDPIPSDLLRVWREPLLESVLYPLTRVAWALCVWNLAGRLIGTAIAAAVSRRLPWIFIAFCSHFLLLTILWSAAVLPLIEQVPESSRARALIGWFVVAPLLAFALAWLALRGLRACGPVIAALAGAGKPPRHAAAPVPAAAAVLIGSGERDACAAERTRLRDEPVTG